MLAVAFRRGKRALVGTSAVVICLGAAVPALLGNAGAALDRDKLAARLMRLDPAARVGGNTQVATAARARVSGARGRVNFMIGLGPRQRIVGGASHDQIGARGGAGARIRGAHGHDLIHGGRGHDHIHGGRGHDERVLSCFRGNGRQASAPDREVVVARDLHSDARIRALRARCTGS